MQYHPTRSLIYVDCVKEEYRIKLQNWLYRYHIPDSISQFEPYCTKYAFYNALPMPPGGENYGTVRMQLTEHYWTINEFEGQLKKTLTEYFPMDVLKWQGNIPDVQPDDVDSGRDDAAMLSGEEARATRSDECMPFIFAFVPICWEDDLKGAGRTVEDGPNYRWQFMLRYPEGVSQAEGDKWFFDEVAPKLTEAPEVTRLLTSRIMTEINGCPFNRVVEAWFEGPDEWEAAVTGRIAQAAAKPSWAQTDSFPFLRPYINFAGIFLSDIPTSNNLTQYRGYITMR